MLVIGNCSTKQVELGREGDLGPRMIHHGWPEP